MSYIIYIYIYIYVNGTGDVSRKQRCIPNSTTSSMQVRFREGDWDDLLMTSLGEITLFYAITTRIGH